MTNEIKLGLGNPMLSAMKSSAKSATSNGSAERTNATDQNDRVSMTEDASRLKRIEEQLSAMPDIDHDKVAEIKKAIADGTFSLDPKAIADKLIGFESSFK